VAGGACFTNCVILNHTHIPNIYHTLSHIPHMPNIYHIIHIYLMSTCTQHAQTNDGTNKRFHVISLRTRARNGDGTTLCAWSCWSCSGNVNRTPSFFFLRLFWTFSTTPAPPRGFFRMLWILRDFCKNCPRNARGPCNMQSPALSGGPKRRRNHT